MAHSLSGPPSPGQLALPAALGTRWSPCRRPSRDAQTEDLRSPTSTGLGRGVAAPFARRRPNRECALTRWEPADNKILIPQRPRAHGRGPPPYYSRPASILQPLPKGRWQSLPARHTCTSRRNPPPSAPTHVTVPCSYRSPRTRCSAAATAAAGFSVHPSRRPTPTQTGRQRCPPERARRASQPLACCTTHRAPWHARLLEMAAGWPRAPPA